MATLMLVDGNQALLDLTMLKLRRAMPEVTIVAGHSCEDARRLAGTLIPDVAVIDRVLPDGDGLSLWELSERFPGIRMILLSSETAADGANAAVPALLGYLAKPYELNEIVDQVRYAFHASGRTLTVPAVGEARGWAAPAGSAGGARRQALSRLAALADGLRALGADLRAHGTIGAVSQRLVDQRLETLVAAVLEITECLQTGGSDGERCQRHPAASRTGEVTWPS